MPDDVEYLVQQGDCISSIADQFGYLWQTIWNHNTALQSKRKNPNALLPGDVLLIPAKVPKVISRAVDNRHKFKKKGSPAKFRLVLERYNQLLTNKQYELAIGDKIFRGSTDGNGMLEVIIPPNAQSGLLRVPEEQIMCELEFGFMDPLNEISGVQSRLQNLGFLTGELSGQQDDDTKEALQYFQMTFGLDPTGELDDATRQKLLERHDNVHSGLTQPPPPAAEPPSDDDSQLGTDVDSDPGEDEREFQRLANVDAE